MAVDNIRRVRCHGDLDDPFGEELWRARIGCWFPELVDPTARASTWPQIAVHQWIAGQLKVPVTVATIAQRLSDDHGVVVSESTVRRYVTTAFVDQRLEGKVTVPRGAVEPGSEAQIDYGRLGMWRDPASGRRVAVWAFAMIVVLTNAVRATGAEDGPKVLERFACGGFRVLRWCSGAAGVRQSQNPG